MIVDGSSLIAKLEKIKIQVPLAIKKRTYEILEEIAQEISNPNSIYWNQPKKFSGPDRGSKYFSNQGINPGLFDALNKVKSDIYVSIDDDDIVLGLGDVHKLDMDTLMKSKNYSSSEGYWRLFEGYGKYMGTRVGKSNKSHFSPLDGAGKMGEGFQGPGSFHPGVESAHMFTSTFKAYRAKIKSRIKSAIKEGLNAK